MANRVKDEKENNCSVHPINELAIINRIHLMWTEQSKELTERKSLRVPRAVPLDFVLLEHHLCGLYGSA